MLKSFLIANPKGGCGKTTLATNLAGYFARQGHRVMLGDIDRQQSAREWLKLRPQGLPPIRSWDIAPGEPARPPKDTKRWVIRRKAEVVAAVRGGLLSLEEACQRYTLTTEEFLSWQFSIEQHGLAGLRTTRIQQYRQ